MHWYKGLQELRRGYVHLDKMEVCKRSTKTHGRLKSNTCNTSWDFTHFTNIFLFHAALSLLKEPSQQLKPDIMNITTTIYLNNGSIPKTPFQDRGPIVLTLHKHIRLSSCAEEIVIYPDKVDKQHKSKMSTTKKTSCAGLLLFCFNIFSLDHLLQSFLLIKVLQIACISAAADYVLLAHPIRKKCFNKHAKSIQHSSKIKVLRCNTAFLITPKALVVSESG